MSSSLERLYASSHLYGGNASFIEAWYEAWLIDPESVPETWRALFESLPGDTGLESSHSEARERFRNLTNGLSGISGEQLAAWTAFTDRKQANV